MFCWASIENTNSLPIRRAGSPVQVSAGPSTANFTPAVCSRVAIALVVLRARSSSAPAQPTQNRYSTSSASVPSATGTSKSRPVHPVSRLAAPMPHGSPLFSRFFSIPAASTGNADSISTWCRRIPSMWSMCSMSTGHSCTHAPQLVHAHSASGSITPPVCLGADQRAGRLGLDRLGQLLPGLVAAGQQVGGLGQRVVAQVQDDHLRATAACRWPRPGTGTGTARTRCRWPCPAGPSRRSPRSCPARTRRCPGRPPRSPAPCRC